MKKSTQKKRKKAKEKTNWRKGVFCSFARFQNYRRGELCQHGIHAYVLHIGQLVIRTGDNKVVCEQIFSIGILRRCGCDVMLVCPGIPSKSPSPTVKCKQGEGSPGLSWTMKRFLEPASRVRLAHNTDCFPGNNSFLPYLPRAEADYGRLLCR